MRRSACSIVAIVLGCASEPSLGASPGKGTSGEATDATTDATTNAVGTGATGPPAVVDIGKDAATLTEGGAIVVTATVRDPDGDDDVVGGTLLFGDADLEVAAFQRGDNGRFSAPLSWSDLVRLDPPTFSPTLSLRLRGRFTDRTGATAEGETSVLLVCAGLSGAACEGTCVDLESHDDHCGACGFACELGRAPVSGASLGGCEQSGCEPTLVACASPMRHPDCTSVCAELGRECATGCDGGWVAFTDEACTMGPEQPGSTGCDPEPFGWPASGSVQCCCAAAR